MTLYGGNRADVDAAAGAAPCSLVPRSLPNKPPKNPPGQPGALSARQKGAVAVGSCSMVRSGLASNTERRGLPAAGVTECLLWLLLGCRSHLEGQREGAPLSRRDAREGQLAPLKAFMKCSDDVHWLKVPCDSIQRSCWLLIALTVSAFGLRGIVSAAEEARA
jgi:hypothetical protein